MKEYFEVNKDKISTDVTSCPEKHDRTEYHQDYYASNLELNSKYLYYLLTSITIRLLRRAMLSLLHGQRPVIMDQIESTAWSKAYYHMDSE